MHRFRRQLRLEDATGLRDSVEDGSAHVLVLGRSSDKDVDDLVEIETLAFCTRLLSSYVTLLHAVDWALHARFKYELDSSSTCNVG